MIDLEFDGALQPMSGIAEAFDAAGIDDHVPPHGGSVVRDAVPDDFAWAMRSHTRATRSPPAAATTMS